MSSGVLTNLSRSQKKRKAGLQAHLGKEAYDFDLLTYHGAGRGRKSKLPRACARRCNSL